MNSKVYEILKKKCNEFKQWEKWTHALNTKEIKSKEWGKAKKYLGPGEIPFETQEGFIICPDPWIECRVDIANYILIIPEQVALKILVLQELP